MTVPPPPDRAPLLREVTASLSAMPDPAASGHLRLFEDEAAHALGAAHAVAVSSGTAALHAALSACGIGRVTRSSFRR